MHSLKAQTAMGGDAPLRDTIGGIHISENSGLALASVSARAGLENECTSVLENLLGDTAPAPGQSTVGDPMKAVWMGPEQWLIVAPFDTHELLADELTSHFKKTASVTEQTDGWVVFDIEGSAVVDMCERLCAAPTRRMAKGDAQRTTIHHMGCFIICTEALRQFRVMGPRSSAGSLHHALITAARSVA